MQMKQLTRDSSPKFIITSKKMGRRLRQFSKGERQMVIKHKKRCLTSLLIKKNTNQDTMRYSLIPTRMAIIKKSAINKCCRGCGEMGTLLTVLVGMKIDTATVENTMIMSQKN